MSMIVSLVVAAEPFALLAGKSRGSRQIGKQRQRQDDPRVGLELDLGIVLTLGEAAAVDDGIGLELDLGIVLALGGLDQVDA